MFDEGSSVTSGKKLRIGILLPSVFSIDNPGNGIAEQARQQAEALERLGHTVIRLNPWQWQDERTFDVLHMYLGGLAFHRVVHDRQLRKPGLLVFSPIIDSNQAFMSYRLAAQLGSLSSKVLTVPGSLRDQAMGADLVICRSKHEQQRVTSGLGVPASKTEIVLNGCHPPVTSDAEDLEQIRAELHLPEKFLLHISAYTQPRKNVLKLVEAASQLGYPLVVAGRSAPGGVMQQLQKISQHNDKLRILGFIDNRTKNALYSMCKVFCLPSIHEGTGLVALEAAVRGANLVITKNGGPPDYFLNHAEYVDPRSVQSIVNAIGRAWNRPRNSELQSYISNTLSWDQSARSLEQAYLKYLCKLAPTQHQYLELSRADYVPQ